MPSSRRMRVTGLVAVLTVCVIFYITNGASSTRNSDFYQRTVAAINEKQAKNDRADMLAEEKLRLERVERLQKEHDAAIEAAAAQESIPVKLSGSEKQKPIQPHAKEHSSKASDEKLGEKSVAGRKYMKDGKVVTYKSTEEEDDGVAKVGNVGPHSSHLPSGEKSESEKNEEVDSALNEILKKGPIIIFSKTYCPFSKKAKHILLDQYSISPPPYVVELDEHKLGPGLQSALEKMTGRRTVPNVLINGKSIGGGDDVAELHDEDKLASKISTMGGKRVVKIERLEEDAKKTEMKFKA